MCYHALKIDFVFMILLINFFLMPIMIDPLYMYVAGYVLLPLSGVGIGIGPPGEFSNLSVKTSTPVSVTSKVCSSRMSILGSERSLHAVLTKLSRPFAIHCYVRPVIRPIDFPRLTQR